MIKDSKFKRQECEKRQNTFMKILYLTFGIFAILLLLLSIISIWCDKLNICFSHFYHLAELFVIAFSLSVAIKTYQRSKKVDEADMLIRLRELLGSKDNMLVHKELLKQGDAKENDPNICSESFWNGHIAETYNYLGTLELMDILLEDGILEEDDFRNQFKYRIENVTGNAGLMSFLHREDEAKYWKHLMQLVKKYGNNNYSK